MLVGKIKKLPAQAKNSTAWQRADWQICPIASTGPGPRHYLGLSLWQLVLGTLPGPLIYPLGARLSLRPELLGALRSGGNAPADFVIAGTGAAPGTVVGTVGDERERRQQLNA